ncbi:RING-type E3 ubiquitin transferase [Quillaja saponaria]|uniref:RING-type E3 ubiquitin transferase n=1 Tax=Quillaja saponaria TaxID=32244 RepID=A0AAD7PJV5_QUISA|nr:RING-type E3 ubiquitin transferase [Quillaja saponaria]
MVSILNGYIKRFLKDDDFRATLRHNCFSSLNFIELEEGHDSEIKVIMSLEQAVEIVEQAAEESASAKDLKKASLQLSVITGLSLNDMKEGFTCGIPNCKLSACAHLYLSVVYKIQKKERVSAKHLLQVFCDSPSQARTTLLPELWDCLFFPHLSHVKVWYSQKADILADTLSRTRKLKLLEKLYNEILDSGTYQFAMYYKDWLTEGLEVPSIPSIEIPSLSVGEIQSGSSLGHSSDLVSPIDPFSPQPMVSKKLYDAVFGCLSKPGVPEDEDSKEDEKLEWGQISDGSAVIRQTITCLSEIIKNIAQDIEEDCTKSAPVVAFPENGISRTTEEKWRFHICGVPPERSFRDDNGYPISLRRTTLNSNMPKALSQAKENELTLKRLAKSVLAMQITESSSDPSVSTVSLSSEGSVSNSLQSKTSSSSEELNGLNEYFDEEPFFSSIPLDFICPLTGKLFEEPVTLETGQTFDRVAIKAWFEQGNRTCPVTGNTLECVAVPLSNFVLKRLIDNWKSEHCRHLLAFASQTVETSEEHRFKQGDEAAVFIIENLLCAFSGEEKKTTAKRLISIGGVQYLLRRFELGKMEEKTRVVTLLLSCIEADSDCRYQIAKNINRKCLLRLLESNQVRPRTNAVLLLTELICLERRKDVYSFLSGLQNESVVNLVNALLLFLRSSQPQLKALVAVLLLHFDLLVEHNKYSIYREEAVDAITVALDASLTDENIRKNCCRALLILEGHFSSSSKLLTGTSILKQAVFCDSVEMKSLDDEEEGLRVEDSVLLAGEKERNQERLRNLLEYLVGDEKRSFLETICRCLHSRNLDLVSVCLTTVAWLSSALSLLHDAGSHFITMSSLISPLKYILENDENVEHKMLASLSLLNFSNLPECRVLLLTILEDLAGPLERLAEVTWTAKKLHTLMIGREL